MKGVAVLAVLAVLCAWVNADGEYAVAQLHGTGADSTVSGYLYFYQNSSNSVTVVAVINGIVTNPDSLHGIHVHEFGEYLSAASTGTHFWGDGTSTHACPTNGTDRSEGDMGNFQANGGMINETKTLDLLTLQPGGGNSIIGRAVVLHSSPDDCANISSSGSRIAWGVIGIGNPTTAYVFSQFPNTTSNPASNDGSKTSNSNNGTVTTAVCYLQPIGSNTVTGTVFFQDNGNNTVTVSAVFNNLDNSTWHGFHVHQYGDLTTNSATGLALGSHYNPNTVLHGTPPNTPRHVGDMGNINYWDENGVAYYQYTNNMLSLSGSQSILGRAVVVHSTKDDGCDPAGNAGSRLATCVIGIANPATVAPNVTTTGNLTQVPQTCATTTTTTTTTVAATTTTTTVAATTTTTTAAGPTTTTTAAGSGGSGASGSGASGSGASGSGASGSGASGSGGGAGPVVTGGVGSSSTTGYGVVTQTTSSGNPIITSDASSLAQSLVVVVMMIALALLA